MKDGWGKFGAGCLGVVVGYAIAVAFYMDEREDRQADTIAERVQRTIEFHFASWRRQVEEAQHER